MRHCGGMRFKARNCIGLGFRTPDEARLEHDDVRGQKAHHHGVRPRRRRNLAGVASPGVAAYNVPALHVDNVVAATTGEILASDTEPSVRDRDGHAAHASDSTSACSSTVWVAFSCLSGGYPWFRRMRLTNTRRCARTFSRTVQSIVTFARTVATSSRAIVRSASSPKTFTALSLVSSAS